MNLQTALEVLKEINTLLSTLQAMGLKVNGELSVADVLSLASHVGKPSA